MPAPAIAILCSGRGTNFQAIVDSVRRPRRTSAAALPRQRGRCRLGCGRLRARVAVMITDNPKAGALVRARRAKIPTVILPRRDFSSREAFDRALARAVERSGARLIVLAGFMRILSPGFVRRFRNRILNIHPALLPVFPGAHAVRDALRKKVKVTGVTVHFVDEQVDHGPVIVQESVPVRKGDTEKTLLSRIHRVEHRLYPEAIQQVLEAQRFLSRKRRSRKS